MEKMKIAVCFSGQVRTWKYCYQNWIDNLTPLGEVDYFCHFWDYNSVPRGAKKGYVVVPDDVLLSAEEKQSIIDMLKPKIIEFESKKVELSTTQSDTWYSKRIKNKLLLLQRNQFYSLMKSASLKRQYELENNFEYDVVIRMRPDSIFTSIPNIEKTKPNILYAMHRNFSPHMDRFSIGDVCFHGDSFTFDQISWFINMIRLTDQLDVVDVSSQIIPEIAFYYYIKSIGITLSDSEINPMVVVTADSMARKGFLQANEILNTSI